MQNNERLFCEQCPERQNIRKQAADDIVDAIYSVMPNADGYEAKAFLAHILEEFWRE